LASPDIGQPGRPLATAIKSLTNRLPQDIAIHVFKPGHATHTAAKAAAQFTVSYQRTDSALVRRIHILNTVSSCGLSSGLIFSDRSPISYIPVHSDSTV